MSRLIEDCEGYSIEASARPRSGGGFLLTVRVLRDAETIGAFDLGREVVFAESRIAESAGVRYGQRWIARQDLPVR